MLRLLCFILLISSLPALGQTNLCDILKQSSCSGVTRQGRRSSLQSFPTPATSTNLNPATVNIDKGFGVEAIYQKKNPLLFSLASGTGKIGAILISSNIENTFFGNRIVELDGAYLERQLDDQQFKSKKTTFATAASLFKKKNFGLDAGVILKRHSEIKKINPGFGLSGRVGFLTLGASVYQDDFILYQEDVLKYFTGTGYENAVTGESYTERFTVTSYTGGVRFKALSLDGAIIRTKYKFHDEETVIRLLSASVTYKNLLLNVARRTESSPFPKFKDDQLVQKENEESAYGGIQVSLNRHIILGVQYNYFLLNEFSLSGTVFF